MSSAEREERNLSSDGCILRAEQSAAATSYGLEELRDETNGKGKWAVVSGSDSSGDPSAGAERDGYEQGYQAGEEAGYAFGLKKAELVVGRLRSVLEQLDALPEKILELLEPEVAQLAVDVAETVVHEELRVNRDVVLQVTREALERALDWGALTLRVNPADYDHILTHSTELPDALRNVTVEADGTVSQGGCVVQGLPGEIDGRVEEAFREIRERFR